MKIESSTIQLSGQRSATETRTTRESLNAWIGRQQPDEASSDSRRTQNNPLLADRVSLSIPSFSEEPKTKAQPSGEIDPEKALENDPRLQLMKRMLEALTGQKIHLTGINPLESVDEQQQITSPDANTGTTQAPPNPTAGFGLEYHRVETVYEAEQTTFSAKGIVNTADGKTLHLSVHLAMSREYFEQNEVSVRLGDAVMKDPLVLNFNGLAVQLTDTKFSFDIDSDGIEDQIAFVRSGSGFLVIDKNGDGSVNNGQELFGAVSGDGFEELTTYDDDKNLWIDENDGVFKNLRLWTKDEQGHDTLSTLTEKEIGAIYLGQTSTGFSLKNNQNQLYGQIKSTGLFLNENGTAGTVQQIDLAA
ncbi:hypothetical protein GO003_000880 [Methylicorpusculum oleiharenae]|uniref:VCBS repeat-containing protein n=1 Tax=Methylicorpusculum oleiharenae TaxID=1338687 RepID=UPI00135873E6|nr:VCBS repeat-containing protein [Methylicorpusculum oleiharenae]MCD2448950.1 hypothetical protein [Methylicorpusculum oleiharenae]